MKSKIWVHLKFLSKNLMKYLLNLDSVPFQNDNTLISVIVNQAESFDICALFYSEYSIYIM